MGPGQADGGQGGASQEVETGSEEWGVSWIAGLFIGGQGVQGVWAGEQFPSTVISQREEQGAFSLGGVPHPPSSDVLGLGFVPCLCILPPRVPSVLRVITENPVPHPLKLQAVKRLEPLRILFVAPLSRKLPLCSLIFSLFLQSLPIPSLCPR